MILLEPGNRILAEVVATKLQPTTDEEEKKSKAADREIRLCDFDDASYLVQTDGNTLRVSMALPCYKSIKDKGAEAALKSTFGGLFTAPANGYDVTITIPDMENPPLPADEIVQKVSMMKTITLSAVFDHFVKFMSEGGSPEKPFAFKLRPDTRIYIVPGDGRCTVIYDLDFNERVDQAVARVFLLELQELRRQMHTAPSCIFSQNPPKELQDNFNINEPSKLGFIAFTLLPSHVDKGRKEKATAALQSFRNYIQYHIKCAKAHFHQRMRTRVVSLLKVLNRAKVETGEEKEKKTITGKTFKRK